ncbi:uncharacterized protein A4U43_C08F14390 [Asparagus officinalis]|nr:uncharacterized protein A4U43_C08F14390 [Asparagus officinalis]
MLNWAKFTYLRNSRMGETQGSSRISEESLAVPVQVPRIGSSGKDPIPLNDKEKQVDYGHDDTDAYLIEPDDVGNIDYEPDFRTMDEAMPTSFLVSGRFEPMIDFEGTFGVLASTPAIEMTKALVPVPISLVQQKLIIHGSSNDDDDALVSPMLVGAGKVVLPSLKPRYD